MLALEEGLRDRGGLLAFLVLPLRVAFLALVIRLAFLALVFGLAFLALVSALAFLVVRLLVVLLADRRDGFSGVASEAGAGAAAGFAAGCAGPRPSPMLLANWDRCSE